MDRIITTSISDPTIQQPLTGNSLDFLQNTTQEMAAAYAKSIAGCHYDASLPFVIYGLYPYGTGNYSEGYVLWNNEVFYCAGKSDSVAFVNIPVLTITVTNDATADPVTFTDAVSRNVHNNRNLVLTDALTGTGTFDLADALYMNKWITASTPTYVALTTADAVVGGGVTVASESYIYQLHSTGIKIWFRTTDITTTATTAKISMTLPISLPTTLGTSSAFSAGACRFYKSGTGGVPCYVWTNQNSLGSGTELQIEKADGTAFGVLANYEAEFMIDIAISV